jgi:hypothetical protein
MDRIRQCAALAAGAMLGAAGAVLGLGFEQPEQPNEPTTLPPSQPGRQPGQPSDPFKQPGQPTDITRQPGTVRPGDVIGQPGAKLPREVVDRLIVAWPAESKQAAEATLSKYGQPDGCTNQELIWHNAGPWRTLVVTSLAANHNFPMAHKDCVLGIINMKVPPEKFTDLARFDGSIYCFRTPGLIAAQCDREELDFAALNLAHDIIDGSKSVEEARDQLAKIVMAYKQGTKDPLTQDLKFPVDRGNLGDPDQPATGGMNPPGTPDRTNPDNKRPGGP